MENFFFFGIFVSSEIERDFRSANLSTDTYQARLLISVSQLLTVLFVFNDYILFGLSNEFWQLLAARSLFFIIAIISWLGFSTRSSRTWDRFFAIWAFSLSASCVFVVVHRPPGFIGVISANLFVVLICYLLMPVRLSIQALAAGLLLIGHLAYSISIDPITDPVLRNTLVFIFFAANAVGLFTSRQMSLAKRRQFATRLELIDSERHYRTLVEASGSLVWTMLPDRTIDFANKPWIGMKGSSSGQVGAADWSTIIHPDDFEPFMADFDEKLVSGKLLEWIIRLRRHDGEYRWVLSHLMPLISEAGETKKWLGTTTDIHDFWTAKLSLGESNEKLKLSLARIRQLEGLLSICSFCKKIRDENEQWQQIESYISKRSETKFSHGVCHDCGVEHYGDLWGSTVT